MERKYLKARIGIVLGTVIRTYTFHKFWFVTNYFVLGKLKFIER